MEKIAALADYLECEVDALKGSNFDQDRFELGEREYLVMTDDEATREAKEAIRDSLWAFRPQFLIRYLPQAAVDFNEKEVIESIAYMQEKLCESANVLLTLLVGCNLDRLIGDAIKEDGRGLFLAGYDHEEVEFGEFFIYRSN